ncbi:uncharacterized protein [Nicotiana tomentosiformis]|uniref:uncharacterized protein n=1 Tax=Nicotiana tomentosiformis TaxID=4098 RepID=UPI00388CE783
MPALIAPPPAKLARSGGQVARRRGQVLRGGGQPARGCPIGKGQNGGTQPRYYAFRARPEAESSDSIITVIVPVFHRDASVLFGLGSTYPYMSCYFSLYLIMPSDCLSAPVYVSTPVGDSIIVDRVYYSCVISIEILETSVYILLLDIVDFDIILGMDWLQRMVEKRCLAYLAYIRDSSEEVPSMDSVPIVRAFPEKFPTDLSGMPPDKDTEFCIDLDPGPQPISIPPHYMVPSELKELKEQLQDLLYKGFIKPNVSPWGAPLFFVRKRMVR